MEALFAHLHTGRHVPSHVLAFFMESFEVMRLAQQHIVRLGKVAEGNPARTVLALGTGLVVFGAFQVDLRVSRIDRLGAAAALVGDSGAAAEHFHAFLNARHDEDKLKTDQYNKTTTTQAQKNRLQKV